MASGESDALRPEPLGACPRRWGGGERTPRSPSGLPSSEGEAARSANPSRPLGNGPHSKCIGPAPRPPPGAPSMFTGTGDDGGDRLLCPQFTHRCPAPGPRNAAQPGSGAGAEVMS